MAIYHLTAKVISRARGQSMIAAAAYRSGSALRDEHYGLTHNYTRRRAGAHCEIMSPAGAPDWVQDREALWNRVEAVERRKDSQLARAIDISLPAELSDAQNVALLREYIAQEFVCKGMIADFCIRRDPAGNPHAHVLLTLREATPEGFGPKARHWNRKSNLLEWRSAWAERANLHLARAGHAARIDHRTLEAQQIELTPGRQIGVGRGRHEEQALPRHVQERLAEQRRIAFENGATIVGDPSVAVRALCRQRPTFTREDLVQFLASRTGDAAQLDAALAAVLTSSELVALASEGGKPSRYTGQDMLDAKMSLMRRVAAMRTRCGHGLEPELLRPVELLRPAEQPLHPPSAQPHALEYLVAEGDIKALAAAVDDAKAALLAQARELWERGGLRVLGVALSRAAAERLQASSGIHSLTLAAQESEWQQAEEPWSDRDVVVVDEAEMIGLKDLERLLAVADRARAKVVLVGDSGQLEAMGTVSPLWSILDEVGLSAAATLP
ncbi:MAG: MobQ family relaxase [Steroidobacteraceae bacterium]